MSYLKRLFLVVLSGAAVLGIGYYAWDCWTTASANRYAAEMRACLDVRDDEPAEAAPAVDPDRTIQLKLHILALDTTTDRVKLFGDDGPRAGVVNDMPRFMKLLQGLPSAETLSMPTLLAADGQQATLSVGQMVMGGVPNPKVVFCGVAVEIQAMLRPKGQVYVHLNFAASTSENPAHRAQGERALLLQNDQTGYLAGHKRQTMAIRETRLLRDLPLVGSCLRFPRHVEVEQELVILVTPKLMSAK